MLLLLVPALALALAGSVRAWQQVPLHLLVAALAVLTARLPASALEQGGRAMRLARAWAILLGAVAVGMLPVPHALLSVVSPGVAAARPHDAWWTLSLAPERTASELGLWALAASYSVLVALWAGRGRRGLVAESALVGGAILVSLVAAGHALTGARAAFGLIPLQDPPDVYFGPLVNPNFLGSLLLLALPLVLHRAWEGFNEGSPFGWFSVVMASGVVALLAALGSPGTMLAMVLMLVLYLRWQGERPWLGQVAFALSWVAAISAGFVVFWFHPDWWRVSGEWRLEQWSDAPRMLRDHWLAGVGGGAHVVGYPAYRTNPVFGLFHHAHSEPVEWVLETGLIGVVALVAALAHLRGQEPGRRRTLWSVGLFGLLFSALWNFPLQVPGVLLVAAGALAVRFAAFEEAAPARPGRVRALVLALAATQLVAGAWAARTAVVDAAAADIVAYARNPAAARRAASRLEWLAPWRPELALVGAWDAEAKERTPAAVTAARGIVTDHPDDPSALRRAALVLWRADLDTDALAALERAIVRDPNDFRSWAAVGRIHEEHADGGPALTAWVEALRHWPEAQMQGGRPLRAAYALAPVGAFWLDALADAPAVWSNELAHLMLEEGEPDVALLAAEQAARLNPQVYRDSPVAAFALVKLGRPKEAEAHVRDILLRHPERGWVWRALAEVLEAQGKHDAALDAYLEAFRLDRSNVDMAIRAIEAGARAGGPEQGLAILERVSLYVGGDPGVGLVAARLERDAGRKAGCVREIESRRLMEDPRVGNRAKKLWVECGGAESWRSPGAPM